ncbi:MAG: sulfide/dihydroorotate dehydrogenase-like FAD/NAD-binding protein [Kiritimatiellae bacterium]|nr:sulfide/dihydroorotate dehydrogenase-like FAD/NAD-binding protein [Kiritimatiellia bacterium]
MNRIVEKKQLSELVYMMKIEAPLVAESRKAGQFVILQVDPDWGERIPLTIADADPVAGTVTIAFQPVGYSTKLLATKNVGDYLPAFLGPLGNPSEIEKFGHVVCVGGGFGTAPLYPIVKALKEAGNKVTVILGYRNKSLIIMEDEMKAIADEVVVMTDDGSYGRQGVVTIPLKEMCESATPPDRVIAIGPPIMMKFCAETTRPFGIKTIVSLNTIMIDGTGMCGGCRAVVGGETKFVCVDGPEFDAHLVDFDNMMKRLKAFVPQEKAVLEKHQCNLVRMADEAANRTKSH